MVEPYFAQEPEAGLTPLPSAEAPGAPVAAAMQRAGGEADLLSYRMQMARRMTVMSQAETAALQGFEQLDEKYRHDSDYSTMEQRYGQDAAKLSGDVLASAKQNGLDPMSAAELQTRVTRYGLGYQKQIFNTAWSGMASTTNASLDAQGEALQNRYWQAGSDVERSAIAADYSRNVGDAANAGWITPEAAAARVRLFGDAAERGHAMQMIQSDPAGAKSALADPAAFPSLNPETRATLIAHATAAGDEQGLLQVQLMGKAAPAAAAAAIGRVSDPGTAEQIYRRGVAPDEISGDAAPARGNNPGNIIDGDWARSLPGYVGANGRFAAFDSVESGAGAMAANLRGYAAKGVSTLNQLTARWAPKGDGANDPVAYAATLAKATGLDPDAPLNLADPAVASKIIPAMAAVEQGHPVAGLSAGSPGRLGEFKAALGQLGGSVPAAVASLSAGPDKAQGWLQTATAKFGDNFTPQQFLSVVDDPKAADAVSGAYQRLAAPVAGFGLSPDGAMRAQLHLASEEKADDDARRRTIDQLASLQRANDPVTDTLMSGYAVDPQRLADYRSAQMTAAANGSAEAAREVRRVDFAIAAAPQVKAMMGSPPALLEEAVTAEQGRLAASPNVTEAERDRLEIMTRSLAAVKAGAASNPIGLAVKAGLTPAPTPLPANSDDPNFAQAMRERDGVTQFAAKAYGAPLIPLQPDEASALKTAWASGTPASKANLAARIAANSSPEVAEAAMKQIGGDDPLDLAAGRIATRDPALGQKVLEGAALLKEPGVKPKVDDVRNALAATLGGGLYPSTQANSEAINAGLAVYASDRAGNGALFSPSDADGLREAITKVTGPIVPVNGRNTPITPGVAPAAVTRALANLSADDLKPFGGLQPDLDPGFVGAHAQLTPLELGGSHYAMQIGGRPVFTGDGRPLVVDLKSMAARGQAAADADQGAYADIFRKGPGKLLWGSALQPLAADDPLRAYGFVK